MEKGGGAVFKGGSLSRDNMVRYYLPAVYHFNPKYDQKISRQVKKNDQILFSAWKF